VRRCGDAGFNHFSIIESSERGERASEIEIGDDLDRAISWHLFTANTITITARAKLGNNLLPDSALCT